MGEHDETKKELQLGITDLVANVQVFFEARKAKDNTLKCHITIVDVYGMQALL